MTFRDKTGKLEKTGMILLKTERQRCFMNDIIITISRQYGSAGRQIGGKAADALNIPFYDKEIIDLAAKESGLAVDFIRGQEKKLTQSLLFSIVTNFTASGSAYSPNMLSLADQVYLAEANAIRALADKGPCVIVGRCAAAVLKNEKPLLRVFISADLESRCRRAVSEYGDSEENIKKTVRDIDKQRARYCQHYYDQAWEDVNNYDLCLNSDTLGVEGCVKVICRARELLSEK